jgi:hypothetical protein
MFIDTKNPFLAYQNWSIKTRTINSGERMVFPISCEQLNNAANNYPDYKPTVVLSTNDNKHYLFSIENFKIVKNNKYSNARINLSTLPYHLLNFNNTLSVFPSNDADVIQEKHTFNDKSYSFFLMETTTSSIKSENGISKVIINKNTPLYAYEQWSANHKLDDKVKVGERSLNQITWVEAINNKNRYELQTLDTFTPTVFIEINNVQYLGVVTDIKPVDQSDEHKVLNNLHNAFLLELTIDTSTMKMRDSLGKVTSLPSLPNILEETNIFMNIDDSNENEILTIDNFQEYELRANQTLQINENDTLTLKDYFTNNGTILITPPSSETLTRESKTFINIENTLINRGNIGLMPSEYAIKTNSLESIISGGRIENSPEGYILIGGDPKDDKENTQAEIQVTSGKGIEKKDFTFIDSTIKNQGKIIFRYFKNDSSITVTGIRLLESQEEYDLSKDSLIENKLGFTAFYGLSSNMDLSKKTEIFSNNVTIGIKECRFNSGGIIIRQILNGVINSDTSNITTSKNVCQETIGIKYMGAVDNKAHYKGISYKLTNPHYNEYGIMDGSVNEDEPEQTELISGCHENSFVYIGNIMNYTIARNSGALFGGATGIYNLIQTHSVATVKIDSVSNRGYGGDNAACGIMNVLVNFGNIHFDFVENSCQLPYDNHKHSKSYGIYKVVQNGYTENKRVYLPPFPPSDYDRKGAPMESDANAYGYSVENYYREDNFFVNNEVIKPLYRQGHISIHVVSSNSYQNEIAIGIGQYGGLAFNSEIMEDDGLNLPIDITVYMQKYVHKYNPLSIVWSYPIDVNIMWRNTVDGKSQYLSETFPETLDSGWLSDRELHAELKRIGWYWEFLNPVQMYYKYEENTDIVTDRIFFPINWGIVNIDYVIAGGSSEKLPVNILGSAYGIEKAMSSMGPIQIDMIESNIKQHYLPITTKENLFLNTNDHPEISSLLYGEDNGQFIDLPLKYLRNQEVTEVYNNSINDLPITVTMESTDIADPENRVDGIWTTGTYEDFNYCWPYHITNKEQHGNEFIHKDHNNLEDEFKLPGNDYMNFPTSNPASTLLEAMSSPGAAYGVFRTIDYSSGAPGLCFMKSFTQPIDLEPNWSIWSVRSMWAEAFVSYDDENTTSDNRDYSTAEVTSRVALYENTFSGEYNVDPVTGELKRDLITNEILKYPDLDTMLAPMPNNLLEKNQLFYWQVVREPTTQNPPFRFVDYTHYPFMSAPDEGRNALGLSEYLPPPDSNRHYPDTEHFWKGWKAQKYASGGEGSLGYEAIIIETNGDLNNFLEPLPIFSQIRTWINQVKIQPYFSDPTNNNSLYIYNSSLIKNRLNKNYYSNIYNSDTDNTVPYPDNLFNGLTPFPILSSSGKVSSISNLSYYTRTLQDKVIVPEKILWNPSAYRFSTSMDSGKGTEFARPQDKKRAGDFELLLQKIHNTTEELQTISGGPDPSKKFYTNFFNMLKSSWPYTSAVKELTDFYYGTDELKLSDTGKTGPLNSVFFSNERGDDITNLAQTLSYNYGPTRPIGFNPQFIQGGLYKIESQHPSYEDIIRENGDARSFLVVSKGHFGVSSLVSEKNQRHLQDLLIPSNINSTYPSTHEGNFANKYRCNNRYYGFTYENRNPIAKTKFNISQMLLGSYSRYKNILDIVNNLIYINADKEDEYQNKYIEAKVKQYQKSEQERQEKEQREHSFIANIIVMLLIPIITSAILP